MIAERPLHMSPVRAPRSSALLALLVSALLALVLAPTSATAGSQVFLPNGAYLGSPVFKPGQFTPTGDGSLYFNGVKWSTYGGAVARGSGSGHARVFPGFKYRSGPVHIRLRGRRLLCGRYYYTVIRVIWDGHAPRGTGRKKDSSWNIAGGAC